MVALHGDGFASGAENAVATKRAQVRRLARSGTGDGFGSGAEKAVATKRAQELPLLGGGTGNGLQAATEKAVAYLMVKALMRHHASFRADAACVVAIRIFCYNHVHDKLRKAIEAAFQEKHKATTLQVKVNRMRDVESLEQELNMMMRRAPLKRAASDVGIK